MNQSTLKMASPLKRLLAALYDSLLVLAVLFIATALTLPITHGEATTPDNPLMQFYLLAVIFIFYAWFWTHGGQTLGMRAWKMQLLGFDGNTVSWKQSLIRFATAIPAWSIFLYGLLIWIVGDKIHVSWLKMLPGWLITLTGFAWLILDNRAHNWRDKLSHSHIVIIDKNKIDKSKKTN